MSFGWSVGDLVGALQLLRKVVIALKDAGGASDEYDRDVLFNLQEHRKQVREPVLLFLKDIQHRFQEPLGRNVSWTNTSSAPRKVQWALSVSKRVKELRRRTSGNVDAVQLCLSQQTIQLMLRLPAELQSLVAQTIGGSESKIIQCMEEMKAKTEELSVEQRKSCELVRQGLEGLDMSGSEQTQKLHDLSLDVKNSLEALIQAQDSSMDAVMERISDNAINIQNSHQTELQV